MNTPQIKVDLQDMGGWIRVFHRAEEPTGELSAYLTHSLSEWMRKRQHLRLRFVVPITRLGETVELHAWYDQVVFPDKCPLVEQSEGFE